MPICSPRPLELLAPARDLATAREAILHGADAVYIGPESHGARAKAANSLADIRALVRLAAPYGVKVYATVNTLVYDDETERVASLVRGLWEAGVDALIVQDLGILEMPIPPIALHASTQCDTRTPEKAVFLAQCGFSQIVLARELSLEQIREIAEAVKPYGAAVEAFVHGALCVCYSGDCRAGFVATGRSANRGECPQMCRLPYELYDGRGRLVGRPGLHYLSMRDMSRIDSLRLMAEAGVSSFKIEGRMKDVAYVKEVTAAYRLALDAVIASDPQAYCRASRGNVSLNFEPRLSASFNRGFTDYFLTDPAVPGKMATLASPKALGEDVGSVIRSTPRYIEADLTAELHNGDGLTWIKPDGTTGGFHLNRAEGKRLFPAEAITLPPATRLLRNADRLRRDTLSRSTATRLIALDLTLRATPWGIALDATAEGDTTVSVALECAPEKTRGDNDRARSKRRDALSKFGGTPYLMASLDDRLNGYFVAASLLNILRRDLVEALTAHALAGKPTERRRLPDSGLTAPAPLTERDNVANRYSRALYARAGADAAAIPTPLECRKTLPEGDIEVMRCRYCLRRELGACLRQGGDRTLPGPLTLKGRNLTYRLSFDCARCEMTVTVPRRPSSLD